jgi:hypothetical protein
MQRPVRGYRGGLTSHLAHTHHNKDNDHLSLSDSNSDNENDATMKSTLTSIGNSTDFESAIRNLRPSKINQKKSKINPNISNQKADLPQLNMISDKTNEQIKTKKSHHWFPKSDIGHADSNDFIRHNHVGKVQNYL